MDANTEPPSNDGVHRATNSQWLTDRELATAAGSIVIGALLLQMQPVRSILKLGALGAAAWAVWHYPLRSGAPPTVSTGPSSGHEDELATSSQRLAEAWGARYQAPQMSGEP